jgi:hypothetical protein
MSQNKMLICLAALVSAMALSTAAQAQWLNYRTPGTPRTADGKPNLTAPAPKTAEGKPGLSGVWMHEITTVQEMKRLYGGIIDELVKTDVPGMEIGTQHKYGFNILLDFKPKESPMRPEFMAQLRRNQAALNSGEGCSTVFGFPVAGLLSEPIKIVEAPGLTMILYEAGSTHRQIYTDGRELPKEFDFPAYFGYSAGHWEGDTLVVETAGFNDKTFLDAFGHPHSEALRVVERFQRRDFGHLEYQITFDDSKVYTKPFTVRIPHDLMADSDIFESFCENEKDRAHMGKR